MKIRTKDGRQHADGDVIVAPTFTTGYKRDLDVARRVIGERQGGAKANTEPAPDRDREPRSAPTCRAPAAAR